MAETERGHNWVILFFKYDTALNCAQELSEIDHTSYVAIIKIMISDVVHYEVLVLCNKMVSKDALEKWKGVVIKQYGIDYEVYRNVVGDNEVLFDSGHVPEKETNPERLWEKLEDSFRNDEGDIKSYYYQRFTHHFDEIITESQRLKRYKPSFGNDLKAKNTFIYGGDDLQRIEKVNEITHGKSVYIKKTDKYWDRYKNEEYVVIEHPTLVSFKRIFKYINLWSDKKQFEARTRHKKFQMSPITYRLIIVTDWDPNEMITDEDDVSSFLSHFTIFNLNE